MTCKKIVFDKNFKFYQKIEDDYEIHKHSNKIDEHLVIINKFKHKFEKYWLSFVQYNNFFEVRCDKFFRLTIHYNGDTIIKLYFYYDCTQYLDFIKLTKFIKEKTKREYICLFNYKFLRYSYPQNCACGIDKNNNLLIAHNNILFKKYYDQKEKKFRSFSGQLVNKKLFDNGFFHFSATKMKEIETIDHFSEEETSLHLKAILHKNSPYGILIYYLDETDILFITKFVSCPDNYVESHTNFMKNNFERIIQTIFRISSHGIDENDPFFKIYDLVKLEYNKKDIKHYSIGTNKIIQINECNSSRYIIWKPFEIIDIYEYLDNQLVISNRISKYRLTTTPFNDQQKIYGYKLGLSKESVPCIIKLEIPSDAYVANSFGFIKYRASKVQVIWIRPIELDKSYINYSMDNTKKACSICLDNQYDKIFLPCKHKICAYCSDKSLEEFDSCICCEQKIESVEPFYAKYITDDTYIDEAYSFINNKIPFKYKQNHMIHTSFFNKDISNGIHFYLDENYVKNLLEINAIPESLKKFHYCEDFIQEDEIDKYIEEIFHKITLNKYVENENKHENFDLNITL